MEEEYHLDLDSNELCRICLTRNCQLKTLFRCDIIDGEIWRIPKVYKVVTNISICENDQFPQNICTNCETAMFQAFLFKQKSVKSHYLLQKILKIDYKEEKDFQLQLPSERMTIGTQTGLNNDAIVTPTEVCEAAKYENHAPTFDYIDEDEMEHKESDNVWQVVYENEDPLIEDVLELSENVEEELDEIKTTQDDPSMNRTDQFECEYCSETVSQHLLQAHLKKHIKIMPLLLTSMEFFRCSRCFVVFPYIENLLEHFEVLCEQTTALDKDDSCIDYQYLSHDPIIRLYSTCKNIDSDTYSCSLCVLDFENLNTFREHFQQEHLQNLECHPEYMCTELEHTCGVCRNSFKNLKHCLHHIYFHQPEYTCTHDNYVTDSFSSLYIHFIHGHPQRKLHCTHCAYQAINADDLKEHQRNFCSARNIKCDTCEKSFYKRSTLNMHMRTHSNEKRFACNICSKAFLQRNDLRNHMRTHTLERPFKCEFCDKSFKTIGQRIGHMATHTTENNFECDVCHKTFKSARILHGHKKIHGERQFICEECKKKFSRKYHLTLHMKQHRKPTEKSKTLIQC